MALKKCYALFQYDGTKISSAAEGYRIVSKKDAIDFIYTNLPLALEAAQKLAAKTPTIPILVLESNYVIETKQPEVLTKRFTEDGELKPASF